MVDQLPILQIAVPLAAAPVCMLLRRAGPALAFATAVCWSTFAMAVLLLLRVLEGGTISYALGAWAPPWGIEYRVDLLSSFVMLFVSGIVVFAIAPALQTGSLREALILGGFFGLITYATYDLTNHATVKNWPWIVTLVDLCWGLALSASVSCIGYSAGRWLGSP